MRNLGEFIKSVISSYKNSMDKYGEARINVSASLVNDCVIRKATVPDQSVQYYLVRPTQTK
jgi:hypothetical protein